MESIQDFKVQILKASQICKNDKVFYILKLYLSFSDQIVTCFVSKQVYEDVASGFINNDNIIEHLYIHINAKNETSFFVK